jgi:hypothetical protein
VVWIRLIISSTTSNTNVASTIMPNLTLLTNQSGMESFVPPPVLPPPAPPPTLLSLYTAWTGTGAGRVEDVIVISTAVASGMVRAAVAVALPPPIHQA